MGVLFGAAIITLSYFVYVSSLNCWMCPGGEASFEICNQNKEKQACGIYTRCGTFSYENKTKHRIYAKSCTSENLCSENDTFCAQITGGGEVCRVQCCDTELCNVQVGFAPTNPPTTITKDTEPRSTPRSPATTASTTMKPTQPILTKKPIEPTPDPQGQDEEDCSWVDAAASTMVSSLKLIIGICLFYASLF